MPAKASGFPSKESAHRAGAEALAADVEHAMKDGVRRLLMQVCVPLTTGQDAAGWYYLYRVGFADITGLDIDPTPLEPKP